MYPQVKRLKDALKEVNALPSGDYARSVGVNFNREMLRSESFVSPLSNEQVLKLKAINQNINIEHHDNEFTGRFSYVWS